MNRYLAFTIIFVAALCVFGANRTFAQTVAPGPYYATPSWDQKIVCDSASNCPRFIVLSNWNSAAVLDRETGLVWERSPEAIDKVDWNSAHLFCRVKGTGGRAGWRVPAVEELSSLLVTVSGTFGLEYQLPAGHPFVDVTADTFYWSTTSRASVPIQGWAVSVISGANPFDKGINFPLWCVRGGQVHDGQ